MANHQYQCGHSFSPRKGPKDCMPTMVASLCLNCELANWKSRWDAVKEQDKLRIQQAKENLSRAPDNIDAWAVDALDQVKKIPRRTEYESSSEKTAIISRVRQAEAQAIWAIRNNMF
ncbi:MAG: hypothetical protein M1814_005175 [Vezdaea aestivalis]|nr:MAG: hypothetical protein M1814_005175 [Vezdaea aestivalis]